MAVTSQFYKRPLLPSGTAANPVVGTMTMSTPAATPEMPSGFNAVSGKAPTPYVSPTGGFNRDGGIGPQGQTQLSKAYSNPQTTQMTGVSPTVRKPSYEDFRNSAYGAQYQRNRNYAMRDIAKAQSDANRVGRETAAQAGVAPGTARYQRAIDSTMANANEAALGIKKQLGEQEQVGYEKYLGRQEQLEDRNAAATTAALQQMADGNEEAAKTIAMMTAQGKTPQEIMQFLGTQNADGTFTFKSTFAPKTMEQQAIDAKVSEYGFLDAKMLADMKSALDLPATATLEDLARATVAGNVGQEAKSDLDLLERNQRQGVAEQIFGLQNEVPKVDVEALAANPGAALDLGDNWADLRPTKFSTHEASWKAPAGTAYTVNGKKYISLGQRIDPSTGIPSYSYVTVEGDEGGSVGYKPLYAAQNFTGRYGQKITTPTFR